MSFRSFTFEWNIVPIDNNDETEKQSLRISNQMNDIYSFDPGIAQEQFHLNPRTLSELICELSDNRDSNVFIRSAFVNIQEGTLIPRPLPSIQLFNYKYFAVNSNYLIFSFKDTRSNLCNMGVLYLENVKIQGNCLSQRMKICKEFSFSENIKVFLGKQGCRNFCILDNSILHFMSIKDPVSDTSSSPFQYLTTHLIQEKENTQNKAKYSICSVEFTRYFVTVTLIDSILIFGFKNDHMGNLNFHGMTCIFPSEEGELTKVIPLEKINHREELPDLLIIKRHIESKRTTICRMDITSNCHIEIIHNEEKMLNLAYLNSFKVFGGISPQGYTLCFFLKDTIGSWGINSSDTLHRVKYHKLDVDKCGHPVDYALSYGCLNVITSKFCIYRFCAFPENYLKDKPYTNSSCSFHCPHSQNREIGILTTAPFSMCSGINGSCYFLIVNENYMFTFF